MEPAVVYRYALPAHSTLHEYRLESVLGAGSFGVTYLGWDAHLEKHVAIKEYLPTELAMRAADGTVVPLTSASEPAYRDGLVEARTLAKFAHPNIVRVAAAATTTPRAAPAPPTLASPPPAPAPDAAPATSAAAPAPTTAPTRDPLQRLKREARRQFDAADRTGSGYLTRREMRAHFPFLARHFHMIDTNGDGPISFDEFWHARLEQMRYRAAR